MKKLDPLTFFLQQPKARRSQAVRLTATATALSPAWLCIALKLFLSVI